MRSCARALNVPVTVVFFDVVLIVDPVTIGGESIATVASIFLFPGIIFHAYLRQGTAAGDLAGSTPVLPISLTVKAGPGAPRPAKKRVGGAPRWRVPVATRICRTRLCSVNTRRIAASNQHG